MSKIDYKISDQQIKKEKTPKRIDSRMLEEVLKEMEKQEDTSDISENIETSAQDIKISNKGLMSKKIDKKGDGYGI